MRKFKVFFGALLVFVLFVTMLPLQAFAAEYSFDVPISQPSVSDYNFYAEAFYTVEGPNGSLDIIGQVIWVNVLPISEDPDSTLDSLNHVLLPAFKLVSGKLNLSLTPNHNNDTYFVTVGTYDTYSNKIKYSTAMVSTSQYLNVHISYDSSSSVTCDSLYAYGCQSSVSNKYGYYKVNYDSSSDYSYKFNEILTALGRLHSDNLDLIDYFVDALNNLATLHTDNVEQLNKLAEIVSGVVQLHSDNVEILKDFAILLKDVNNIETILDQTLNYLSTDLTEILFNLEYQLMDINSRLDIIIDLLQPDTDVNVSKVDPSNFNEYNKAEQSLLNSDNVDVSGAMNVEINQQALTYIWPLLERCINTNPKVIGLTFTILAVSLVALILGRKGG